MTTSPAHSPSKGKARDTTHWRSGWWDFYPLLERPKRPIEWSHSSVIFTAHPTLPFLSARHFSSSKQFAIPSPAPVMTSPSSYDPPTVISVSPADDWLFAYFPGKTNDGAGCLWKRGSQVDTWTIKEWWSFPRSGGVVAASWLGSPREWEARSSGTFTRLPLCGPRTPVSNPTLVLITQDHQVNICYFRDYIPTLKMIKSPINVPQRVLENKNPVPDESFHPLSGLRMCTDAAIGLAYSDETILIATRSRRVPTPSLPTAPDSSFNSMNFDVPVDVSQQETVPDWEMWGEECTIELTEIQLRFDYVSNIMGLFVNPQSSLYQPRPGLSDLLFISNPPSPPPLDPVKSSSLHEKGSIYLVASFLDFSEFNSTPKSELVVYSISRQPTGGREGARLEASRIFSPGILSFVVPFLGDTSKAMLYAGVLDTSGTLFKGKTKLKEVSIGTVKVLNVPTLSDDENWEYSAIKSSVETAGEELPIRAVLSPNSILLATLSSSLWPVQTAVQMLPKPHTAGFTVVTPPLSFAIAKAILNRRTPADIIHLLALPGVADKEVADVLYHALLLLDQENNGLPYYFTSDVLGIAVEIYKSKANRTTDDTEKELMTARWETAFDVCSMIACGMVLGACNEGDRYDLDAVWQLIGICSWATGFLERLMKECVLYRDMTELEDVKDAGKKLDSPILLHLVHPFALQNLFIVVRHVKQFRAFVGSLPAGGESARIARDILVDFVDQSGINFISLDACLEEMFKKAVDIDPNECRKALVACQPVPAMYTSLGFAVQKLSEGTILNKAVLFLKPEDFVDGLGRLSLDEPKNEKDHDVITKGTRVKRVTERICLRCGGKSNVNTDIKPTTPGSTRWRTWEKVWNSRCICGGLWSSATVQ
ncbi:hypothetical protein BDQ17DRAFT_1230808 [Cyathus striatus]|nr:hypothetical protein BDQ17DRAFT_1230808 [Cyathus striatus]